MERRQGRWGGEEGERLNPARIWTGGWFLSPSRCAEALEAILGISTKNKLIKREREEKSVILPIYVSRCAGSAPAACSVTGKAVVSGIKGVCAGPSPSLLLVLQIRYSSAAETGGASHETIFLPLFFLFFLFLSTVTRQRRQSEWPETEKELMNESLSLPLSPALPSIAPCKLWLPHSYLATAGGCVMNTLWRNVLHHAWCTRSRWRRDKFCVMGQEIPTPKKRAVQCNGKCNMGLFFVFLLVFCFDITCDYFSVNIRTTNGSQVS